MERDSIREGYLKRRQEQEFKFMMNNYAKQENELLQKLKAHNDESIKIIRYLEGDEFTDNLIDYVEYCNEYPQYEAYKYCIELPVSMEKHKQVEDGWNLVCYVTQSVGMCGDDYSGHIYVYMPKTKKYFYFTFAC